MSTHNHKHDHCKHEHMKYCAHCDKPYCMDCGQEWNLTSIWMNPIYPAALPQPRDPIYPQWWPYVTSSTLEVSMSNTLSCNHS